MCGFHIWILFDTPVKLATLKSIGDFLIAGRGTHEVFPKQSVQKDYGNYVRLPGRHHKNTNWHSDFYDFEFNKWHRGADAVQFMLDLYINTIEDVSVEAKTFTPPERISSNGDNGSFEGSGAETYSAYKGAINSLDIVALSKDRLTGRVVGVNTMLCVRGMINTQPTQAEPVFAKLMLIVHQLLFACTVIASIES